VNKNDEGYEKADILKAYEEVKNREVRNLKTNKRLSICASINSFKDYGVGVYLYFMFLKWMAWGFTFMTLLTIPALVSNNMSDGLGILSKSSLDLISAGN